MPASHSLAVIPDVHMRRSMFKHAKRLGQEGHPLVFLGDYANKGTYGNSPEFLDELFAFAEAQDAVLLTGNHDLAYRFPDRPELRTKKYEPATAAAVAEVYKTYSSRFKFVYRRDNYLFSHAGLSVPFLRCLETRYGPMELDTLIDFLNEEQPPELFYKSAYNEGPDPVSGPLWLRLPNYQEPAFTKEGITQIVGHTSQPTIRYKFNLLMIDVELPLLLEW